MLSFKEYHLIISESIRYPVSVRTDKYKIQFDNIARSNPRFKETAAEIWKRFESDPNSVSEFEKYRKEFTGTDRDGNSLKFYKLEINPPGSAQYRAIAFEPNDCDGLLIWVWVGTHEEYNKVWRYGSTILKHIPPEWVNKQGGLEFACKNARDARSKNLPFPQTHQQALRRKEFNRIQTLKRLELKNKYRKIASGYL